MKKSIIAITCLMLISINTLAQGLTLEYNFGYGTYNMSGMKNALKSASESGLKGVKTTDNFPSNFTNNLKIGILLKQHQIGMTYTHQNTSGQNHLADYSGEYKLTIKNAGNQLGAFYRFLLQNERFTPFIELSTGIVFCNSEVEEYARVTNEVQSQKNTLTGVNFFVQPAIGLYYKISPVIAVTASAAYEWNPTGALYLEGDSHAKSNLIADWSGLRISAGIITYFKFK